ncbi:heme ABC transporter ATP-binding protein [bacterium]|nr:heme ABC transporter ATP-binding protein [bacterium]
MRGITKVFGPVVALDQVDLTVESGHIHAIVGENGAGKTTLMRVLYGAHPANEGSIELNGQPVSFRNPEQAIRAGVGMVSQHYAIIPELTCLQNLLLGAEPSLIINQQDAKSRATDLATQMGFQFNWDQQTSELSPGQAQKLEILKLLWRNAKILILDEPTAMLAPEDADLLYAKLHELTQTGATVLVVTHRLPDVMEHCDRVTVLRGGKLITSIPVSQTNPSQLAEQMIGVSVTHHTLTESHPGAPILTAENLTILGDKGQQAVKSASFILHQGELVGIAGVDGNGQRELFHALMGLKPFQGTAVLDGQNLRDLSTQQRIVSGLRLVAEDRHHEAVIESWSIVENTSLGLHRLPNLKKGLGINRDSQLALATAATEQFPTKFDNIRQSFRGLSGGNQQKVVVARALQENPRAILAFQPTRGIDLYVADLVYRELIEATRRGITALVVSFDLDEIMTYCDRILVMNHGILTEVPPELRHDRQAIGRMMVGATP